MSCLLEKILQICSLLEFFNKTSSYDTRRGEEAEEDELCCLDEVERP